MATWSEERRRRLETRGLLDKDLGIDASRASASLNKEHQRFDCDQTRSRTCFFSGKGAAVFGMACSSIYCETEATGDHSLIKRSRIRRNISVKHHPISKIKFKDKDF